MVPCFDPAQALDTCLCDAAQLLPDFDSSFSPEIRPADPRFGHFQANGVLAFAKHCGRNPRLMAEQLLDAWQGQSSFRGDWVSAGIAGPGFINMTLSPEFLTSWLHTYRNKDGLEAAAESIFGGKTFVVDYPSPNTAKQMHIGHLRPIVIGEAIQRLLRFCGAKVVRDNHIGDWGANFGILLMALKSSKRPLPEDDREALAVIEMHYREGTALAEQSDDHLAKARQELALLQQGDRGNLMLWKQINAISDRAFREIYERLGLKFDVELGESFYRDKVNRVYRELLEVGIAEESDGALVVFHPGHPRFAKEANRPQPFIIRKRDGTSNYASADLATALYRVEHFHADAIIYVTDARQRDHFEQLFLTVKRWFKHAGQPIPRLEHIWFGTILGQNGKAIKTKSGNSLPLRELLDEAVERAYAIVSEKTPQWSETERRHIAERVGISAVRYADLMQNRTADYVFSWEKLLSFEGHSAPYLLMAVARIYSIFGKLKQRAEEEEGCVGTLQTTGELALASQIVLFPFVLKQTVRELLPHYLCTYLYDLAGAFSRFYSSDKVLVADASIRARRLMLCARTLCILETGLHLLGVETVKRM